MTNYQVTYPDNQDKIITTAIFLDGQMRLVSHSIFRIVTGAIRIEPDEVIDLPGIRAGFYNGCNADRNSGKTVIYLSGIDIMEDRSVEQIYQEMLQNDRIIQLKNDGYNFLVVDWKNSRIDMRFNALYLLNLIEERKCTLADDQQFVMIGESMGGVIGRYLLTYMETGFYIERNVSPFFEDRLDLNNAAYLALHPVIFSLPTNWCRREKMHNTRLLITLDAPHQGANIPLSYQLAYKAVMDQISSYIGIDTRMITRAFNLFLDGQAAQQLLIYHVDTKSGGGWYYNYESHPDRASFMRQLRDLGNYPRFAKVVAMSNGALSGQGQNNPYTNQIRVANDRLIDFHTELFARILWFKIPIFGGDLVALTNPNGNGKAMKANAGFYSIRIK